MKLTVSFSFFYKLILGLVGSVFLLELGLGYYRFYMELSGGKLALFLNVKYLVNSEIESHVKSERISRVEIDRRYCSPEGRELRSPLAEEYRTAFEKLTNSARSNGSHLILLYFPISSISKSDCREFFTGLAKRYLIDFVDLSSRFADFSREQLFLLPDDPHLSRLGQQLIAEALAVKLHSVPRRRSNMHEDKLLAGGGLPAGINQIVLETPNRPYRLITDANGFRRDKVKNGSKRKVLILGDSFSYAPLLAYADSYCGMLDAMFPETEFLNAAVSGYSINQEFELFERRAKFSATDIVILQVSDNDLTDLLPIFR